MRPADRYRKLKQKLKRRSRYETFEERLALSAQPIGDFAFGLDQPLEHHYGELAPAEQVKPVSDFQLEAALEHHMGDLEQQLNDVHEITGVNDVHNAYGFQGAGQTVAIIDSGIGWDHVALGGGLGTGYKVVGGFDFAENDSDPYDDGPSGFHGTHVAGIVGSTNDIYPGVASEVDLVGLRVFDDDGAGYFSWVEDALQWVHDHRNDFENPITTVNLSLGTTWNSDSVPNWSTVEDEFAQLEADGIFIAVSAGNSFADYNTPGLSYPAASPHVVPVASIDNNGSISDFSQRNSRVLAAPGRSITSTVPDHVFGADGNPNDFGTASGTSMASPYVAGASVLVRQAMEFVGVQNITQDTIYEHFRDTATLVYDSLTNANYHVIDVQAAINALMPDDDYGSTSVSAHSLGTLNGASTLSGLVGTLNDLDFFSFTAGATGELSFTFDTTHELDLNAQVISGGGSFSGNTLTIDVVAGQTYTISLGTANGIGFYDAEVQLAAASDGGSGSGGDSGSSGGDSDSGGEGESSTDSPTQIAYDLDQAKELTKPSADYYLNWGGQHEKWLQGNDGWYFIVPNGEVYKWAGSGGATGGLVATLDASYYNDPAKLHDAQPPAESGNGSGGDSGSGSGSGSDSGSGGSGDSGSDDSDDGGGSDTGSGSEAGGDTGGDQGSDSGSNDSDEDSGGEGEASTDSTAQIAYDLDQAKQFTQPSSDYYLDWGGRQEKWLQGNDGWYFIFSNGDLYKWAGSGGATGTLVATLDATYYNDPAKLHDAQPASDSGSGGGSDSGSDSGSGSDSETGDGSDSSSGDNGSGSDAGSGSGDEEQSDNSLGQIAYDLDQAKELTQANADYYYNWDAQNEKWLKGNDGWYYIKPNGEVYKWGGRGVSATLVVTLDASYHTDPSKLHDAQPPSGSGSGDDSANGDTDDSVDSGGDSGTNSGSESGGDAGSDASSLPARASELDQELGLKYAGGYYTNWAGLGEKWMTSTNGQWYFINANGELYAWNGSQANAGSSTLIETFDSTYHADPSKLHDAPQSSSLVNVYSVLGTWAADNGITVVETSLVTHGAIQQQVTVSRGAMPAKSNGSHSPLVETRAAAVDEAASYFAERERFASAGSGLLLASSQADEMDLLDAVFDAIADAIDDALSL